MIFLQKGILFYYGVHGKYGLLKNSKDIVKIHSWADPNKTFMLPDEQELYFDYGLFNRKSAWAFTKDFVCFSNNKKELRKFRKKMR